MFAAQVAAPSSNASLELHTAGVAEDGVLDKASWKRWLSAHEAELNWPRLEAAFTASEAWVEAEIMPAFTSLRVDLFHPDVDPHLLKNFLKKVSQRQ